METPGSREVTWRLEMAHALIGQLPSDAGLRATVIAGSTARGYSDAYSDIELILFWDAAPDPDQRRAIMAALEATYRYRPADPGYESAYLVRGVPVDVWHLTVADHTRTLDSVLHGHSVDLVLNNRVEITQTAIPVAGVELIASWRGRVRHYPPELAQRFFAEYLPHFHLRHLGLAAHRSNPTASYHTLSDIQCSLFMVLLALNRMWFPTFRWMYPTIDRMPLAPARLGARLRQMYVVDPPAAVEQLRDVLRETVALVEYHCPDLDRRWTDWARYGLELRTQVVSKPS